jgi:PhzF family phenazine biosynthesis protein
MSTNENLYRIAAFAESADGGNPAGVWVGEALPDTGEMQRIAAEVGFSETAFVAPAHGAQRTVRYYSPEAEVPFCGHATIAAGYVLGTDGRDTTYRFSTAAGEVTVAVRSNDGKTTISLTSVEPRQRAVPDALLEAVMPILGWHERELDPRIPPSLAFAGAWHLVLAAREKQRLDNLDYDFAALKALMLREDLTTLQLIWRASDTRIHARDPFPVGGVVEDPATGAAAAALGGYLRDAGLIAAPARFEIRQGEVMGRPSLLTVNVPVAGGISVSGSAVEM